MKRRFITIILAVAATLCLAVGLCSCDDYGYDYSDEYGTGDGSAGGTIAERVSTIEEQSKAIEGSISTLEQINAQLTQRIDELKAGGEANQSAIDSLTEAKGALDKRISELETAASGLAGKTWVEATYSTLEQYSKTQTELAQIKASIALISGDLSSDAESALSKAIAASEAGLKEWVGSSFEYKTNVEALEALLNSTISDNDAAHEAIRSEIEEQKTELDSAEARLTDAYKKAIADAIEKHDGEVTADITNAMESAKKDYDAQISKAMQDLSALALRVSKNESDIEGILDRLDKLEERCDALAECLSGNHVWDDDRTVYTWADGLVECKAELHCVNCNSELIKYADEEHDFTCEGYILTAKFDSTGHIKPATLDLRDGTEMTLWQIQKAVGYMATHNSNGDGTYTVEIKLAGDVGGERDEEGRDVFYYITTGFSHRGAGEVNLIISGVSVIPERAFHNEEKIGSVTIGEGVENIGYQAFGENQSLKSVNVIGTRVVMDIDNPEGSEEATCIIGNEAFAHCSSLTQVTIGSGVKRIENGVFQDCPALTDIYMEDGVTSIGENAFGSCGALLAICIPDSVTYIGNGVFAQCSSLKTVIFGTGVNELCSSSLFYSCGQLITVEFRGRIEKFGTGTFDGAPYNEITLWFAEGQKEMFYEEGVSQQWDEDKDNDLYGGVWTEFCGLTFKEIIVPFSIHAENCTAEDIDSQLRELISNGASHITVYLASGAGSEIFEVIANCIDNAGRDIYLSIEGAREIPNRAFVVDGDRGCGNLYRIALGYGVERIGDEAFLNTSVTEICITDTVTSIGYGAFSNCSNLRSIYIPDSVEVIGNSLFAGCSSLELVQFGSGINMLCDENIFEGCDSLELISFEAALESVNANVFSGIVAGDVTLMLNAEQRVLAVQDSGDSTWIAIQTGFDFEGPNEFCGYLFKEIGRIVII